MNNKMKKFNKILMMTVAILLTLVLASTSVVSGIFAKYVVTKSATTEVSLKAFGIKLTVTGMNDAEKGITTKVDKKDAQNNSIAITVSGVKLAPNEKIDDVVKFTIEKDGGPNVDKVNLKIKTDVSGVDNFNVTNDNIKGVTPENLNLTEKKYIPLIFTMESGTANADSSTEILGAWTQPNDGMSDTNFENAIAAAIVSKMAYTATKNVPNSVEKVIWNNGTSTTALSVGYLSFGFKAYGTSATNVGGLTPAQADAVQTYLSTNSNAKLTVTYTVSLEQVV